MEKIKKFARNLFIRLRIPVTKNIEYDIYTEKILSSVLRNDSSCVDVGAHKGEIVDLFFLYAPSGIHYGFEPIPALFRGLQSKYGNKLTIFPYALSASEGQTQFNLVLDDPAYSGLKQRKYKTLNTRIEEIDVEMRRLDDVMSNRTKSIDLIKIDVEGGEFDVMKGAIDILSKDKPFLIFEFGKGASEFYGTKPEELYAFLSKLSYHFHTLKGFTEKKPSLSQSEFCEIYESGSDYYFICN